MVHLHFGALVEFCLSRRAPPNAFQALLKQLNHKEEVLEQDITQLLSTTEILDPLLVVYLSTAALTDQSTNLKFSTVVSNLKFANDHNQFLILSALITELRNERDQSNIVFSNLEVSENVDSIFKYLKFLLEQRQESLKLYQCFINLLIDLLPKLVWSTDVITPEQTDLLTTFFTEAKSKFEPLTDELEEILARFTKRGSISGSLRQSISISPSINGYSVHSTFLKTNKLPKFIWLNSAILYWSTHEDNFLSAFDQFVKIKTTKNTLNELLAITFEGYSIALQSRNPQGYFVQNWKLFLLKRLPLLIKGLNLKNIELSLTNAFHLVDPKILQNIRQLSGGGNSSDSNFDDMFSSFPSTTTDVRHEFLKSCIALGLLSQNSFKIILDDDASTDGKNLPTTDDVYDAINQPIDFQESLNRTLISINTEFVSLEESGLLEFLGLINDMEGSKQVELSKLILSALKTFINEDDKPRLYRLSVALGLCPDSLRVILFHLSPSAILKPLMSYLDKTQPDSEDMNFQEDYAAFGCVSLLFLLVVRSFNISLDDLISYRQEGTKRSFSLEYLNNLGTSRQLNQNDTNKLDVLTNWMTALFDSGGISDDLLRMSSMQECFDIFPGVFQQAFIGCRQGLVDIETIKGGLEYFLQPFLLSTIVGILAWSENYLWKNQDVSIIVTLLKTLLNPSDISGDAIHIHKIILSNFTNGLYNVLEHLDTSPNSTKIDPEFLSNLRQISAQNDSPIGFFHCSLHELVSTYSSSDDGSKKKPLEHSSLLESFHARFHTLLNWGQSSSIPVLDYQSLITLMNLLGDELIIDYFLSQISTSQSLANGKNAQLLIEAASFFLVVNCVDTKSKNGVLKALKSGVLNKDKHVLSSRSFRFSKALLRAKSSQVDTDLESEVISLFFDKLIEDIHNIDALN